MVHSGMSLVICEWWSCWLLWGKDGKFPQWIPFSKIVAFLMDNFCFKFSQHYPVLQFCSFLLCQILFLVSFIKCHILHTHHTVFHFSFWKRKLLYCLFLMQISLVIMLLHIDFLMVYTDAWHMSYVVFSFLAGVPCIGLLGPVNFLTLLLANPGDH